MSRVRSRVTISSTIFSLWSCIKCQVVRGGGVLTERMSQRFDMNRTKDSSDI